VYSNILVPLDGSKLAELALPQAKELARAFGSRLHVVQVISPYAGLGSILATGIAGSDTSELGMDLARRIVEFQKSKGDDYLKNLETRLQESGIDHKTALLEGVADEMINEYARENDIDLIVMSAWGASGLKRFLLGSVTDRVVRSSDVTVMVVRPPEQSA
jgi:nucleotide-binding universal stress UspA family protein